jgi:hypothetical protein
MSDLPKRLQEQAAANQKALSYRQANARTARAARQQGRKRPTDPVEEKKKRKPVAAVQDEIGFRFYFTSSFLDLSSYFDGAIYPRSNHAIEELATSYQVLVDYFGDDWSSGVIQLAALPLYMQQAGYRLGQLSSHAGGFYGTRWLDRLSSLDPATFTEVRLPPFSRMEFEVVQPSLVTAFEQVNASLTGTLIDGFDDGIDALENGSIVLVYEDAIPWDVPAWSLNPSRPFESRIDTVPIFNFDRNEYVEPVPTVKLHTFRANAVKVCQEAFDSGAIVLLDGVRGDSYVSYNYNPALYRGLSGVDQGGNDALFDLLALGVDALDLSVNLQSPGSSSSLYTLFDERGRFERFLDQQHPAALRIEAALSDESRFCTIIPSEWEGISSVFKYDIFQFEFSRDAGYNNDPFRSFWAFLYGISSNLELDPDQRADQVYQWLATYEDLDEAYWRKAADIARVRVKAQQAAANAYLDLSRKLASGYSPLKLD